MSYQSGAAAKQLELEHFAEGAPDTGRDEKSSIGHGPSFCAICQTHQVMVPPRRASKPDLFHTLCFRCYHQQMQRKRMAKRRRSVARLRAQTTDAQSGMAGSSEASGEPKYRDLEHRRRRAQIAARRELDAGTRAKRSDRVARAAAQAGRV